MSGSFRCAFAAAGAVACAISLTAAAETVVRTFDNASNPDGWNWGYGNSIPSTGGNPGSYLRTDGLVTFAPQPAPTSPDSIFLGNYREKGVTCVGVDLITFAAEWGTGDRPMTLMLIYDNGTPNEFSDDSAAFFMGPNIPHVGQGWVSYDFSVPSASASLPEGWELLNLGDSGAPSIHSWDTIIQNVTDVRFHYGDPRMFFLLQGWILGMDNVRICMEPPGQSCAADIAPDNGDGQVNVDDLLAVISNWGAAPGNPADIDGDGTVNVSDLLAVINAWGECP